MKSTKSVNETHSLSFTAIVSTWDGTEGFNLLANNHDNTKPVARHYTLGNLCVTNMKMGVLCPISGSNERSKRQEMCLIHRLGTVYSSGINGSLSFIWVTPPWIWFDLPFLCLPQSGFGFPHCWLHLTRNWASLRHGNVSDLFWSFVSYLPIFITCFVPIQNMCFSLFTCRRTLPTKALRSKRREVFLSVLGSCYTSLHAKLFEDVPSPLSGYMKIKSCKKP